VGEKIYNKLVRDKIPQIVKQDNKVPITYVATKQEVKPLLMHKLIEELEEFKATPKRRRVSGYIRSN
jgi:predicted house-cleaning noncanonical NTP pyrophosphatase (MazG superfamily)